MSNPVTPKKPKGRSPAYPSINLERAIYRVEQVYERERQYPLSTSALPGMWGYSTLNGPAAQHLSALLKFGLLTSEGSKENREVRVSDLAVEILNHPSADARQDAIQKAALLPPIHQEMWVEYGGDLPSDSNLLWRLTRDRGFTETGAREFVREWRDTMEFAGLTGRHVIGAAEDNAAVDSAATVATHELAEDVKPLGAMTLTELSARPDFETTVAKGRAHIESALENPPGVAVQAYPIPIALSGRPPVVISGAFPLTENEWARFKAVLEAMKPVLVGEVPVASSSEIADSRE